MNKIKMVVCVLLGMFGADAQDVILENCERGRTEKKGNFVYACFGDKWTPFRQYGDNLEREGIVGNEIRVSLDSPYIRLANSISKGYTINGNNATIVSSEAYLDFEKGRMWLDHKNRTIVIKTHNKVVIPVAVNNYLSVRPVGLSGPIDSAYITIYPLTYKEGFYKLVGRLQSWYDGVTADGSYLELPYSTVLKSSFPEWKEGKDIYYGEDYRSIGWRIYHDYDPETDEFVPR